MVARAREVMVAVGQTPVLVKRELPTFVKNRLQGVLLLEMFRLIREGYVSPPDADALIRDGFGLRWAFLGPLEGVDLNAPGGIADYLTRYAAKVYLVHRRSELRASKVLQERLFANPKIEPVWNKQVLEIEGREQAGLREVTALRLKDTVTGAESRLAASGCFVFIGFRPNSGLIREHFRHDASG